MTFLRTPLSLAAIIAALLVTLLAAPAGAQAQSNYQHQARVVTNHVRDGHDVKQLDKGACVQKFARRQARKMARRDRMFHQDLGTVLKKCHLTSVGENVAAGYSTGRAAVKAWLKSPGHRDNLLSPGFKLLGMAVRRAQDGTPYAAQVFGTH